jgi:acetyltransferase-like isoleucine patch superfamily enzyme
VFPTPISAVGAHQQRPPFAKDYSRVPPLHDPTRAAAPGGGGGGGVGAGEADTLHPASAIEPALPRINILHPSRTASPAVLAITPHPNSAVEPPSVVSSEPRSSVMGPADHHHPHPHYPHHPHHPPHRNHHPVPRGSLFVDTSRPRSAPSHKQKMLRGELFAALDPELRQDKERCGAAVWRFNNALNPAMGIQPAERARLLHEIVVPRPAPTADALGQPAPPRGYIGDYVTVDAPFHCDFGYNLRIGRNVVIERGCQIGDAAEVRIGDNCRIAPNVCIYTTTLPDDPMQRRDIGCLTIAKPVVIHDDVFVGANVVILSGVTIGKGSIVGAGSLVKRVSFLWGITRDS